MPIRVLELFCDGGSWGAHADAAEIICGMAAWHLAIQAYSGNFPKAKAIQLAMTPETGPAALGDIG